jgi:hypothetical protein
MKMSTEKDISTENFKAMTGQRSKRLKADED